MKEYKERWINAAPDTHLTWGKKCEGEDTVNKIIKYYDITKESRILEVGPGYGRTLRSLLRYPFKRYVGVDISKKIIDYLRYTYRDDRVDFIVGDIEDIKIDETFDIVISFVTLHHMYPDCSRALSNIRKLSSRVIFDFPEGEEVRVEEKIFPNGEHEKTFIHHYSKSKIAEILLKIGYNILVFDSVSHDYTSRTMVYAESRR